MVATMCRIVDCDATGHKVFCDNHRWWLPCAELFIVKQMVISSTIDKICIYGYFDLASLLVVVCYFDGSAIDIRYAAMGFFDFAPLQVVVCYFDGSAIDIRYAAMDFLTWLPFKWWFAILMGA